MRPDEQNGGGLRARRAFTLIEVMIAVLILALGLLGLGAVFPVVVRSQRTATEDTLGTSAMNSAKAFIASYDFRSAMEPWGTGVDRRNFWRNWRDDDTDGLNHPSSGQGSPSADESGHWVSPLIDSDTGEVLLGVPGPFTASCEVILPLRERLWPAGAPQFVWDMAVHRVSDFKSATDATHDDLEVAIFVRRLDLRIRVNAQYSMYEILTGERLPGAPTGAVEPASRRIPVGVFEAGPQAGLPTGDGTGAYAAPIVAEVEYLYNPPAEQRRDRLHVVNGVTDQVWQMLRQPGQKLVDNLGQIHTVRSWGDDDGRYLVLEAPVKTNAEARESVQQVVFTPQVPASVFLMRVKP